MNYNFDDTLDITNRFDRLLRNVSDARDCLEQTELERDNFVQPIIEVILNFKPSIESILAYNDIVIVSYGGSRRGYAWTEEVEFPRYILDAADPLAAARTYKEAEERAKNKQNLAEKRAELKRLQEEIDSAQ